MKLHDLYSLCSENSPVRFHTAPRKSSTLTFHVKHKDLGVRPLDLGVLPEWRAESNRSTAGQLTWHRSTPLDGQVAPVRRRPVPGYVTTGPLRQRHLPPLSGRGGRDGHHERPAGAQQRQRTLGQLRGWTEGTCHRCIELSSPGAAGHVVQWAVLHRHPFGELRRDHGALGHFASSLLGIDETPLRSRQLEGEEYSQDSCACAAVHKGPRGPRSPFIQDVAAGVQAQGFDRSAPHDAGGPGRIPRPLQSL